MSTALAHQPISHYLTNLKSSRALSTSRSNSKMTKTKIKHLNSISTSLSEDMNTFSKIWVAQTWPATLHWPIWPLNSTCNSNLTTSPVSTFLCPSPLNRCYGVPSLFHGSILPQSSQLSMLPTQPTLLLTIAHVLWSKVTLLPSTKDYNYSLTTSI